MNGNIDLTDCNAKSHNFMKKPVISFESIPEWLMYVSNAQIVWTLDVQHSN